MQEIRKDAFSSRDAHFFFLHLRKHRSEFRPTFFLLLLFLGIFPGWLHGQGSTVQAADYETANFVIRKAPTPALAQAFGEAAEKARKDMARLWLEVELPDWSAKCPITVKVGNIGAGGVTTFVFHNGEVYGWEMEIQGTAERIIDSVLPHEITHMVFASHFRDKLPRWLDEGLATSVEHEAEKSRYRDMLDEFLDPAVRKGIPFNRMVAIAEYPEEPMPLYAQGFSVVEFLLTHGGHRRLTRFAECGMEIGDWRKALRDVYGYETLGELQTTWVAWVSSGKDVADLPQVGEKIAALPPLPPTRYADSLSRLVDMTVSSSTASVSPMTRSSEREGFVSAPVAPPYAIPAAPMVLPGPAPDEPIRRAPLVMEWSRPIR